MSERNVAKQTPSNPFLERNDMLKRIVTLSAVLSLGIATASQAALIEDFEDADLLDRFDPGRG